MTGDVSGDILEAVLVGRVIDGSEWSSGITEGLLTEYRSIRCLNYVKFLGNTDYDFPQELNGIN